MRLIPILLFTLNSMAAQHIFDFSLESDISDWNVVDDVVMGGRSDGPFQLSPEGHGEFRGTVSLENNGGFSSVRYSFAPMATEGNTHIRIRLKGDGKSYQFRIRHSTGISYSYNHSFDTAMVWEDIVLPLKEFYPTYRGRNLDLPNFEHEHIEEIAFLISNKKPEKFKLLIDFIRLE